LLDLFGELRVGQQQEVGGEDRPVLLAEVFRGEPLVRRNLVADGGVGVAEPRDFRLDGLGPDELVRDAERLRAEHQRLGDGDPGGNGDTPSNQHARPGAERFAALRAATTRGV
jgi:hypothetical protein